MDKEKQSIIGACKQAIDMVVSGNRHSVILVAPYPEIDQYAKQNGLAIAHSGDDSVYAEPKKVAEVINFEVLTKVKETYTPGNAALFREIFEEVRMLPLAEGILAVAHRPPSQRPGEEFVILQLLDALQLGAEGIDRSKTYGSPQ